MTTSSRYGKKGGIAEISMTVFI